MAARWPSCSSDFKVVKSLSNKALPLLQEVPVVEVPNGCATNVATVLQNDAVSSAVRELVADLQKAEQQDLYKLPMHLLKQVVFISKNISGTPTKWGNPLYVYQNNIASWSAN